MGFGQAFITLGGAVTGFGEFYVGLFWVLFFGSLLGIGWTRFGKRSASTKEAPARYPDRRP